ncbi:RelA/SpoT family protein [Hydrogenovibrio kuenenii]|uniref:RelA/SpoT family protein n=1 Tax=Hydrogenovibrio kuenenii TaxID=63658 RepID=UPI000465705F|nr:bifunctional (p)ppGpp synthetase/guanosine-3',5'-bis(diphosphate) 3'-pyrophosphohydrolase [Hydrogenovibrio kuenenii]
MTTHELYQQVFHKKIETTDEDTLGLKACELAIEAYNSTSNSIVRSAEVAIVLAELKLDRDTLIATLLSDGNLEPAYSLDKLKSIFSSNIIQMVKEIRRLNAIKDFSVASATNEVQTERLRQMLLAMTSDIRIMIVKLAYRVVRLRNLKNEADHVKQQISNETQLIFAPLANRLGIAQLKWELEDLSFRYLQPDVYKSIAQQLDSKRAGREAFINNVIDTLKNMFDDKAMDFKISGRPKHIYSIWKKMTKKNLPIDELYDLRAVRIYVDTIEQCYEVLGMIHSRWNYIKDEFDDYIATPKENGYQSIHTVIIGAENKTVEIQIRTYEMHRHAEYGVAAHWRYKEGGKKLDARLEQSINLVRQMLEYNDNPDLLNEISTELLSEHIYAMTPTDEIITLSKGSTALDFAYYIHTELGHRCRGAKVNGRIVPLTYQLKTGDKVEVLTVKSGEPSRNWLNPNLGYLGSSRSRTKVRHWFNHQNKEANRDAGEAIFNKEVRRLHAHEIKLEQLVKYFKCETTAEFYEALGKGQINDRQLNSAIQKQVKPQQPRVAPQDPDKTKVTDSIHLTDNLNEPARAYVVGSPQLKTQLAPCCHPTENNEIIGYVTRGRGITVHKKDCNNILNLSYEEQKRLITVSWTRHQTELVETYEAELSVLCFDRKGLLRDIMTLLAMQDINIIKSDTQSDKTDGTVTMQFVIELDSHTSAGNLLDQLEQVDNVESASINLNKQ